MASPGAGRHGSEAGKPASHEVIVADSRPSQIEKHRSLLQEGDQADLGAMDSAWCSLRVAAGIVSRLLHNGASS